MPERSEEHVQRGDTGAADGLLVVGIGASAGGIAALKRFFAHVPAASRAAYAVILHLAPDYESRLAEVLQAATPLPIEQVRTRASLRPDHVYVIAPDSSLTIADGHIVASPITRMEERRAPVDMFFRTLAESYGRNAVSVVLSGTGPNGSSGLKRVKEHGGLAIAQDPDEAEYSDMPRHAIASGLVDYVLPVADIPRKVLEYRERLSQVARREPWAARTAADADADAVRDIITIVRTRTGHDFSNYKPTTVLRRIERRVSVAGLETLSEYADFMRTRPDEPAALMKELLISVTNFFRDPAAYAALERRVIPQLFYGKAPHEQVRVWVAGCATGEEAYSIAMLLAEYASGTPDTARVQVFASDLDERAIATAREGFYTDAEVADVSQERLHRFFYREPPGYRVRRELRELVLYAQHNVIRDPPFSHLDLLTCRNLLIYLTRSIQERLLETFHFALRPGGYLFLGSAESSDGGTDLFATVDKDARIYASRAVTSRLAVPVLEPAVQPPMPPEEQRARARAIPERVLPIDLHHRLLEEYAPPSIVVTDEYVVVHVSQRAGEFLQIGRGEPARDVLQLVHPGLRLDLRAALHQAVQERSNVTVRGVRFDAGGRQRSVDIVVRPVLRDGDPARGFFLIIFDENPATAARETETVQLQSPAARDTRDVEEELLRIRGQLGATIEQYETQVEEAKASNEELHAANEELRSSTEELETSKEELQSVNEELTTVNQELKIKIEELRVTNNDFHNFINATSIPTIFLDREMRVKLSTSGAQEVFNLLPADVGRRLSDITTRITYGGILEDAAQVLRHLQSMEREVHTRDGRAYLMRILPYRTTDDRIEGVVLTFVDVTILRHAEARVQASEERLRALIDGAVDYAIFTMSDDGRIDSWNTGAERLFQYSANEIVGTGFDVLFTPADRAAGVPEAELVRARRDGRAADERYHLRKDGTTFYVSGVTSRVGEGSTLGFAKIARDMTRARAAAEALERARNELEVRVRERTAELQQEQERVRGLLRRIVSTQEEQRRRIARDLHDQLGQQLTALRLTLERAQQNRASGRDVEAELERGLALAGELNGELDFIAWELRPAVLDDLGLAAALPRFLREWANHYGIHAEFRSTSFATGHLSKDAEVTYYRIAQEALNNVLKHAHAARVDVVLETRDDTVTLVVADDGVGFESTESGALDAAFGLLGMRERANLIGASLDIESAPGQGTTVFVRSPRAREGTVEAEP